MAQEPVRRCIHCHDKVLGRGLHNHVRWGEGPHGAKGELPDTETWDIEDYPIIGYKNVDVDRESDYQSHERYVCGACFDVVRGENGIHIHADQREDGLHDGSSDVDHIKFPADTDEKVVRVPNPAFEDMVELSDYEQENGWTVKADPALSIASDLHPRGRTNLVISALRKHFENSLLNDEDIDPVEVMRVAENAAGDDGRSKKIEQVA